MRLDRFLIEEASRQVAAIVASATSAQSAISAMRQLLQKLTENTRVVVNEQWTIDGTRLHLIVWKSAFDRIEAIFWDGETWEAFEMPKSWG